jgi:hypothetical protein
VPDTFASSFQRHNATILRERQRMHPMLVAVVDRCMIEALVPGAKVHWKEARIADVRIEYPDSPIEEDEEGTTTP